MRCTPFAVQKAERTCPRQMQQQIRQVALSVAAAANGILPAWRGKFMLQVTSAGPILMALTAVSKSEAM